MALWKLSQEALTKGDAENVNHTLRNLIMENITSIHSMRVH